MNPRRVRLLVLVGLASVYFVVYPEDLTSLLTPLEHFVKLLKTILELTQAISPWVYGVSGLGVAGWTAQRVTARILESRAAAARATRTNP